METIERKPTPPDLRAAIARSGLPAYIVGARVGIHPNRLSRILHGHDPLPDDLAYAILNVVKANE